MSEQKSCNRCHQSKPVEAFWHNKAMKDGFNSSCKQCNKASGGSFPKDIHPSRLNWDGHTTYSTPPPLQTVYYGSCLSSGHETDRESLTREESHRRRLVGEPPCAICGSIVFLTEDSDGFRGAGVQRHHTPSRVVTV